MNELPADLADPLHLLTPFPYGRLLALLATLALLAVLWILYRRFRRRPAGAPAAALPPPPAVPVSGIEQAIEGIRRRYKHADRRQGCHQLSARLREHFEQAGRPRFSTLTVREIAAALGDVAVARFFALLAELQFGRRKPSRDDFQGICELALETVSKPKKQGT